VAALRALNNLRVKHGPFLAKVAKFGSIGGSVALFGIASMYVLVSPLGMNEQLAFLITTFASVMLNFSLNWRFTWKDRNAPFWWSLGKFILSRAFTIPFGQLLFFALNSFIPHYIVTTIVHTALMTVLNFVIGDRWTFRVKNEKKSPTTNAAV
jgi:putative flippase GtrA